MACEDRKEGADNRLCALFSARSIGGASEPKFAEIADFSEIIYLPFRLLCFL
jgi:hypothetical protein